MIKTARKFHQLDATGKSVGRLASQIALILRGKNKAEFSPHLDLGDIVRVVNTDKFKFSGKKIEQKVYHHYSGFQGGLKTKKIADMTPAQILKKAVREMLPPTKHRIKMLRRLIISTPGSAPRRPIRGTLRPLLGRSPALLSEDLGGQKTTDPSVTRGRRSPGDGHR